MAKLKGRNLDIAANQLRFSMSDVGSPYFLSWRDLPEEEKYKWRSAIENALLGISMEQENEL